MANEYKNFTELDYSKIKDSLKQYLESQDELKDYNFDGSALNILLRLLAYNTQYNAFYANMMASEKFLSLAQRRQSVVDLAKNIGYTPRSRKAAIANISFQLNPVAGFSGTLPIPADTLFSTKINDKTYTFRTENEVLVEPDGNSEYHVSELEIFEGKKFTHSFTIESGQNKVTIPNQGVDTSKLYVVVKDSVSSVSGTEYTEAKDFTKIDNTSQVYFVEEGERQLHDIVFGDGVVGVSLDTGNVVEVTYYKTNGSAANNGRSFSLASTIPDIDSISAITVDSKSYGGAEIEDIDTIRLRAPAFYERQNRAVTARDFKDVVQDIYPVARGITAWGGEDNVPPSFGVVYVSIIPEIGFVLSDTQKNNIENNIKANYSVMSITPIVVNPKYIFIEPSVNVSYDSSQYNVSSSGIKSSVSSTISDFKDENLGDFDNSFRFSRFVSAIDDSRDEIISNSTDIRVYIEPKVLSEFKSDGGVFFFEPIVKGTAISNEFGYSSYTSAFFEEDGEGSIYLYNIDSSGQKNTVISDVGTVDYEDGSIQIDFDKFNIDDINLDPSETIKIYMKPENTDIIPARNQVLAMNNSDVTITVTDTVTGSTV